MWTYLVRFILRNRVWNLVGILLVTLLLGYKAMNLEISYDFASMLPASDSTLVRYQQFKERFGQDGSIFFIGMKDEKIYNLDEFNAWNDLIGTLKNIDGVQEIVSFANLYKLVKNDSTRKFDFQPIVNQKPQTQHELDSLIKEIYSYPFYDNLLYNKKSNANIMAITLSQDKINNKKRILLVNEIKSLTEEFSKQYDINFHYSGLPYIRTVTLKKVQSELRLFVLLAMLIASIALFIFFRSVKAVLFPMFIVTISIVWSMGVLVLLGYKITLLTGIIPPLVIIIGVENCIFLLNKFHHEFRSHGNKIKALSRVVQKVGNATFLTNLTTATGFAAFIVTRNQALIEFGIVASISIMIVFFLTLFLIPIFYSYLSPPKKRHTRHLDNRLTIKLLDKIIFLVQNRRNAIYLTTLVVLLFGIAGIFQLKTTGNLVDDISHSDPLYKDLMFFENEFNGILPFEISIDTRKQKGAFRLSTIRKINQLQDSLRKYPEFSKPLSIADVVKFAKQAFYNNKSSYYSLPNSQEKNFILSYVPNMGSEKRTILNSFIDTNLRVTRITVQIANVGTHEIKRIKQDLKPIIDDIFPPSRFDVEITGTSVVFLKGTEYLVRSLLISLILAIIVIGILMALLFTSFQMVGVSIITNLLPQILTAALMGFLLISIKPSTILIFSIALGISVDNTIHFLSRYRMELKTNNWNIKLSVISALKETGFSMIYSSIVLFFGFAIFTLSTFGGTKSMGFLISFTLLIAVLSNLLVLPSLLLSLDRRVTTKSFKEPLIILLDEEEDIELSELEIEEPDTRGSA
ncbi:MAG: MMPL family transporter [Bacteroidales bacterium]|nr:MMPL family transporter [Bacteroidales bacterium]